MTSKGLGRGLDALFPADLQAAGIEADIRTNQILTLPVSALEPNKNQPRKSMSEDGLEELSRSIQQQGVIQPLLVRRSQTPGKYQIVAGERRWRAARMAKLEEVPVFLKDLSDEDVMLVALVENLQREDLNPAEEAQALHDLKTRLNITQEDLASRLGRSRSKIANSLRLLQLPKEAFEALQKGKITAGHARCLLPFAEDREKSVAFLRHILQYGLSVRECEDILENWKTRRELPWQNAAPAPVPHKRTPKSPAFRQIEKDLASLLNCKAKISGSNERGKVSFIYGNEEELKTLLAGLGLANVPNCGEKGHRLQEPCRRGT